MGWFEKDNIKFQIGQKVRIIHTNGGNKTGHISGIEVAQAFRDRCYTARGMIAIHWNEKFPGWDCDNQFVYYVWLDEPSKSCTMEEIKITRPNLTDSGLREEFERMPMCYSTCHPAGDLEEIWS
jgi:hypothetical protein